MISLNTHLRYKPLHVTERGEKKNPNKEKLVLSFPATPMSSSYYVIISGQIWWHDTRSSDGQWGMCEQLTPWESTPGPLTFNQGAGQDRRCTLESSTPSQIPIAFLPSPGYSWRWVY